MKKHLPIIVGVALIVGGGSFYGGMKYAQAKSPARGARGQFATFQGGPGGQGGSAQFRGRTAGGGFVGGQILSNDGKTLTIKMNDGGSKIVFLSDATEVSKFTSGSASDLEVGKNVMVVGKANDDGSVTAQSVQIRPEGAAFPGGRPQGTITDQPKP